MITVTNLSKQFRSGDRSIKAVSNVSFDIPKASLVAIVGKSGSGKSTLLSLLGGLDTPDEGSILVDGQEVVGLNESALIKYRAHHIGFVFQSYNLIPNLTAAENVMLAMEFAGLPKSTRQRRAAELLNQVGLDSDKQIRKPGKLSGGEQQRVAIARSLANTPALILADEPTGNLDSETSQLIIDLLDRIAHDHKTTILVVTHDDALAKHAAISYRMKDGDLSKT